MIAKEKGFTLIELMVTLMIASIILMFALPSFTDLVDKSRVRTTSKDLVELLRLSRLSAVEQRNIVSVCGSSDQETCDHDWTASIISIKRSENGEQDQILATLRINDGIAITKNNNNENNPTIDFRSSGWAPWDQTTFTICPTTGKQQYAYQVVVAGSGKVKLRTNSNNQNWCS